jgi:hypothetical protein
MTGSHEVKDLIAHVQQCTARHGTPYSPSAPPPTEVTDDEVSEPVAAFQWISPDTIVTAVVPDADGREHIAALTNLGIGRLRPEIHPDRVRLVNDPHGTICVQRRGRIRLPPGVRHRVRSTEIRDTTPIVIVVDPDDGTVDLIPVANLAVIAPSHEPMFTASGAGHRHGDDQPRPRAPTSLGDTGTKRRLVRTRHDSSRTESVGDLFDQPLYPSGACNTTEM